MKKNFFSRNKICEGFTLKSRACQGFTLIELLVVISIIGVLMTISLVAFAQSKKSARDSKRKADLEQIRNALEIYRTDCKTYPAALNFDGTHNLIGAEASCVNQEYMSLVPADPVSTYSYYYYYVPNVPNKYTLCAYLETNTGGTAAAVCGNHCGASPCNYSVTNP